MEKEQKRKRPKWAIAYIVAVITLPIGLFLTVTNATSDIRVAENVTELLVVVGVISAILGTVWLLLTKRV